MFKDIDVLESRTFQSLILPAVVTYSFVPDGTAWGGGTSVMDGRHPVWRDAVRRAFRSWSFATGVLFSEVPDGGVPMGSPGPQGTVRVGGVSAGPMSLAWAYYPGPQLINSDIVFNSSQDWGRFSIEAVALHEIGHAVFDLDHGDSPVMSPTYTGTVSPGDSDALSAIRSVAVYPNPANALSKLPIVKYA